MVTIDLETLVKPVSENDPCGPDLDLLGDPDFLNFFAAAESCLPQSYFRARDASGGLGLFDPKMIDFASHMSAAEPVLGRTRDIRLIVLLAKLLILNRDLTGFATCMKAIAELLSLRWEDVHPRSEDGDFAFRGAVIEAIDVAPTVIMPLHFFPIVQSRRFGIVNYRTHLIALGQATAGEDETTLDAGAVQRVLEECDIDELTRSFATLFEVRSALEQIGAVWADKNGSGQQISFGQLATDLTAMTDWLSGVIVRRRPNMDIENEISKKTDTETGSIASAEKSVEAGKIASIPEVAANLEAISRYFAKFEPSSPARLIVDQCRELLGKSFVEVLRALVPTYAEQAAFHFGREGILDIPVERMGSIQSGDEASDTGLITFDSNAIEISSRSGALANIEQVIVYFRIAEPSSPIPILLEQVRDLGQRDFLSLLRSILPPDAIRASDS